MRPQRNSKAGESKDRTYRQGRRTDSNTPGLSDSWLKPHLGERGEGGVHSILFEAPGLTLLISCRQNLVSFFKKIEALTNTIILISRARRQLIRASMAR